MGMMLGGIALPEQGLRIREETEDGAAGEGRRIELSGVVAGDAPEEINAALDALAGAAPSEGTGAPLVLRPGRRMWVRREKFQCESRPGAGAGGFVLKLIAWPPWEESEASHVVEWEITAPGSAKYVIAGGNRDALPIIRLTALSSLERPGIGDGARTMAYEGILPAGTVLVFDAAMGRVTRDGEDVTPWTVGEFPRVAPGGSTLTYTGAGMAPHVARAEVEWRSLWR